MQQHTSRLVFGRPQAIVFGLALAVVFAACSDSSTGPHSNTPAGDYAIATVNSKAPPVAILSDTNFLIEFTAGTCALTSDGKYTRVVTFRQTIPGNVSTFVDSTRGTWTLSGTTVRFVNSLDTTEKDSATWASGTLTFVSYPTSVINLSLMPNGFSARSRRVSSAFGLKAMAAAATTDTLVYALKR
jgi:hypothetical protein